MKPMLRALILLLALLLPSAAHADILFSPAAGSLLAGATIGETLATETLTLTCAGVGLSSPVGAWSCSGDTITRTASGANLTLAIGPAVTIGKTYRGNVTYATLTAGTFSLSVGGLAQVTHSSSGTYPEYFPAVSATTAPTITAVAASAGTITLSSLSVRAKDDSIVPVSGPLGFYKEFASATANEAAVTITGNQTGAAGDKMVLALNYVGTAGSGAEYLLRATSSGTDAATLTTAGTLTLIGSAGGLVVPDNASSALYSGGRLNIRQGSATLPMSFWNANDFTGTNGVFVFSQSSASFEMTGANAAQKYVYINPEYDQTGSSSGVDLQISRTETALGSGAQKFISFQAGAAGTTEKFWIKNTGSFAGVPPTAQTIAAGNTVAADACGTVKMITAAGAVTTDTTNTFTAPAADNAGCCMDVYNSGAQNITLDTNALFKSPAGLDVIMTPDDAIRVCSTGSVWYAAGLLVAN